MRSRAFGPFASLRVIAYPDRLTACYDPVGDASGDPGSAPAGDWGRGTGCCA